MQSGAKATNASAQNLILPLYFVKHENTQTYTSSDARDYHELVARAFRRPADDLRQPGVASERIRPERSPDPSKELDEPEAAIQASLRAGIEDQPALILPLAPAPHQRGRLGILELAKLKPGRELVGTEALCDHQTADRQSHGFSTGSNLNVLAHDLLWCSDHARLTGRSEPPCQVMHVMFRTILKQTEPRELKRATARLARVSKELETAVVRGCSRTWLVRMHDEVAWQPTTSRNGFAMLIGIEPPKHHDHIVAFDTRVLAGEGRTNELGGIRS